jgi:hypothetical protein
MSKQPKQSNLLLGHIYEPIQGIIRILRRGRNENNLIGVLIAVTDTSQCVNLLMGLFRPIVGIDGLNTLRHGEG